MTIRERVPIINLFGCCRIGSRIGKEIKPGGFRVEPTGPENEDDPRGPWTGYYVVVEDPDTLWQGRAVDIQWKNTPRLKELRLAFLPPTIRLEKDKINHDEIARRLVHWQPEFST